MAETASESTPRQRLFFALWPDETVRAGLLGLARQQPGKHTPAENLHLTLAFLGSVHAGQRACVEQLAASIQGRRFTLTFDYLGYWPRPRIAWVGAHQTPPELVELTTALNAGLPDCRLEPERRPYRAHLTLSRKVRHPTAVGAIAPIVWPVARFVLVESRTRDSGAEYRVIGEWQLVG